MNLYIRGNYSALSTHLAFLVFILLTIELSLKYSERLFKDHNDSAALKEA